MTFEQAKNYLLEKAAALGLGAEVLASQKRIFSLAASASLIEEITSSTRGGVGLRVVQQGKTGYAYTEERTPQALDWVLQEAIENAQLQDDTSGFIAQGQVLGHHDLLGEGLSSSQEHKTKAVLELEKTLASHSRTKQIVEALYEEQEDQTIMGSTQGLSGSFRTGISQLYATAVMGEAENVKQGAFGAVSKEFHTLDPSHTAHMLLEKTERLLDAKPLKTGKYPAYFEPKAFAQLWGVMGEFMVSAQNALEGKSPLQHKLGQRIAASLLSVIDDPTLENGLYSRPFDAEGTPAARTVLIDQGIFRTFLHNTQTASKLQQPNTGHAQRSYKSTLDIGYSNLYIVPGAGCTPENGIVITDLAGLRAGANPITGDFSIQALGLLVQDGEVQHAVENFTVSGNFLALLEKIVALGSELEWDLRTDIGSPMAHIEQLSFAGG
jgi:PmbA protein